MENRTRGFRFGKTALSQLENSRKSVMHSQLIGDAGQQENHFPLKRSLDDAHSTIGISIAMHKDARNQMFEVLHEKASCAVFGFHGCTSRDIEIW